MVVEGAQVVVGDVNQPDDIGTRSSAATTTAV